MAIKDTLIELRESSGLTQSEMAERLFVTRQAVSRWECGETKPGIDTLKLIATEFHVPVEALLDMPLQTVCQSCGMPLASPDLLGTEADGSPSERFCKWCYESGAYQGECTMQDMVEICVEHMATPDAPFTESEARAYMEALLPALERWQGAAPDEAR
ncbi:XRE family transcriptional regulator [Gordonibacter sp. An230]|uniref:zinc ribbon domain-containing protein n=1 Tax=Gordonibacter sp. An230 TaxID=1965592 RepID=UPI000B3A24D2|nr:zinc ribbon domain-containing protein [Gordonibacter sp. An230]OUO87561.1 XRE family transcriptional regulator [Gordonibacter sp. An230]